MAKHFLPFILCLWTVTKADAQKRNWETIVFISDSKDKGVLKEANDSSLVLLTKSGEQTLLFDDITRLKFVRKNNTAIKAISGSVIGATIGAAVTARHLSKGRTGEPAALSGVIGGIGGGIVGGIIGGFTVAPLCNLLFARKIEVKHTPVFYQSLRQELQVYLAK